eukprot:CAMPEP_0181225884 /NCGR_PEP_ID=MMETSP1096-20121128/31947_1 /TAXON_ID=156174 ORGANISM="Chrysochromulina ericina, Strain CCMP281" /NCGR_SAMPLE_ID=MMETSP1096 /ASSEMBLY_ACC=CAM_ASM_000453 /LENGTH=441 /DNA_ID=CAMNT_0023319161 /DNA_START=344 /DNA_END=1667 /DNA_ORIENTATION=+
MTGRRHTARGDEFAIGDSEYADETALPFCSRSDLDEQTPRVIMHFGRWGMEVHEGILDSSGKVEKDSKSEVLFCSAPLHTYTDASTFDSADLSHVLLPCSRFMPIVSEFPAYLGDTMAHGGSDGRAVDRRISSAGKAFCALHKGVFSSTTVHFAAKHAVFESVILSILLYDSESWSLRTQKQPHITTRAEELLAHRSILAWSAPPADISYHPRRLSRSTSPDPPTHPASALGLWADGRWFGSVQNCHEQLAPACRVAAPRGCPPYGGQRETREGKWRSPRTARATCMKLPRARRLRYNASFLTHRSHEASAPRAAGMLQDHILRGTERVVVAIRARRLGAAVTSDNCVPVKPAPALGVRSRSRDGVESFEGAVLGRATDDAREYPIDWMVTEGGKVSSGLARGEELLELGHESGHAHGVLCELGWREYDVPGAKPEEHCVG